MAVYSMTGFASASQAAHAGGAAARDGAAVGETSRPAGTVHVELRSVNSRFLDLVLRLPDEYRGLEPALRDLLTSGLKRGKVELKLTTEGATGVAFPQPQPEQLNALARLEGTVQNWLPKAAPLSVNEALHWLRAHTPAVDLHDAVLAAAREALQRLRDARAREGARLVEVMLERVERLRTLAAQAEPLVPAVVRRQQQRFLERWQEALDATGAAQTISRDALQERALNEAAAFAIRIDVAEELARLRAHLDELACMLKAGGELGKRMDFLVQELLREANTLASKAASLELTNVSVEMKVAIEQLREQVQNIE